MPCLNANIVGFESCRTCELFYLKNFDQCFNRSKDQHCFNIVIFYKYNDFAVRLLNIVSEV